MRDCVSKTDNILIVDWVIRPKIYSVPHTNIFPLLWFYIFYEINKKWSSTATTSALKIFLSQISLPAMINENHN